MWSVPINLILTYDSGISCFMSESHEVSFCFLSTVGNLLVISCSKNRLKFINSISGRIRIRYIFKKPFQTIHYEQILQMNLVSDELGKHHLLQLKLSQTDEVNRI